METYSNKDYWSSLVGQEMKLKEVGWPNWTEAYNRARYKLAERQNIKSYRKYLEKDPENILEIGCGVGYWTNVLTNIFPGATYTGVDISGKVIEKLRTRYAGKENVRFINADMTTEGLNIDNRKFDLIVCYEVMLHIVDDAGWARAVNNMLAHLSDHGVLMLSDPFTIYKPWNYQEGDNCKVRSKTDYEQLIARNKSRIVDMQARTFLLDNNFDFKSAASRKVWDKFFRYYNRILSIRSEFIGSVLGAIAYGFDALYTRVNKYGHSCRLMIIKKDK